MGIHPPVESLELFPTLLVAVLTMTPPPVLCSKPEPHSC